MSRWHDDGECRRSTRFPLVWRNIRQRSRSESERIIRRLIKTSGNRREFGIQSILMEAILLPGSKMHLVAMIRYSRSLMVKSSEFSIGSIVPRMWRGSVKDDRKWIERIVINLSSKYPEYLIADYLYDDHDDCSELDDIDYDRDASSEDLIDDPLSDRRDGRPPDRTDVSLQSNSIVNDDEVVYHINLHSELSSHISDQKTTKSDMNRDATPINNVIISPQIMRCKHSQAKNRIIFGYAEYGKTSLAKFLLDYKCLVAERLQDLSEYDPSIHNGIVFENIDFSSMEYSSIASLLMPEKRRLMIDDSRSITITGNTKLIFTSRNPRGIVFGSSRSVRRLYKLCEAITVTRMICEDISDDNSDEFVIESRSV